MKHLFCILYISLFSNEICSILCVVNRTRFHFLAFESELKLSYNAVYFVRSVLRRRIPLNR